MNNQKQVIMSNPNVNVSCEKRRSQAGRADDNLLSLEKINFKKGDELVSIQVKAYLQTEKFLEKRLIAWVLAMFPFSEEFQMERRAGVPGC